MIFYKIFSNFLILGGTETISYIRMCVYVCVYTKLSNQSDFACGWPLVPLGFGFYIFIYLMINKYITSWAPVILAKKILKKSEKVVKLDSFGLYNILGGLNEIGTISFGRVYAQCNFLKKFN